MTVSPWRQRNLERTDASTTVALPEILLFFGRRWIPIVILSAVVGLSTFLVLKLLASERYRATATLVVAPPPFSSELNPEPLPVRGFQRLLESDSVLAQTSRRLAETEGFDEGEPLKLGSDIESRIFVSRGSADRVLAPVIEVVAYGRTPERAASKANVWAQAFLDTMEGLVDATKQDTLEVIEEQYGLVRGRLEELEDHRVATEREYQDRLDALTLKWDKELLSMRQETEDLVAQQQTESHSSMLELAAKYGLVVPADGSVTPAQGDPRSLAGVDEGLRTVLSQVLLLRIRLAQTPSLLTLEKAITNEALWYAMTLVDAKVFELQPLWNRSLVTQEQNPVYTELALRLADLEGRLEEYVGDWPSGNLRKMISELERLQRERSAGLAKLLAERAQAVSETQRQKRSEVDALSSEKDVALDRIDRDIASQKERFELMSRKLSQGELARAEQSLRDVRLGSHAVAPTRPEPDHALVLTFAGVVAGGFLGLLLALVLDLRAARGREVPDPGVP
jgi:uncharacterized protein involved in exopolysaccharide biosynthesis